MSLIERVQSDVLQKLGRVSVTARHAVESVLSGQHRSVRRGLSVEFAGHRIYRPGDDLRRLDWKVFARTDRHMVRVYEEETRLRATLVLDCSGSMAYASGGGTSKLEYARMLTAALAFLMVRQADSVGLALVDTTIREYRPPKTTMGYLLQLLDLLESTPPGGETGLAPVLERLAETLTRRGLVILISDLFDDPDAIAMSLRHLQHRKQDVRIFQILDPDETAFPFQGMVDFLGLENEPRLRLDADRIRERFHDAFARHQERVREVCHAAGVILVPCRTDEDLAMTLVHALAGAHIGMRGVQRR